MGQVVIFSGSNAKSLKPNLDLAGNVTVLSGAVDPTSSATSAPKGSVYLNTSTGLLYRKTDAGSSTNWLALSSNSAGDILETSFSAANNQSAAANVTGLAFSNSVVRSANILLSVYVNATTPLYEAFTLTAIQKGSTWDLTIVSAGDSSGFIFTITTAGQIQYTNSNYTGFTAATLKFRAITTSV